MKVLERIVAQPGAPLETDIWLDTSKDPAVLKYFNGEVWKPIAGGGGSASTDVLKYSEQSLTDAQKTQARANIGAAEAGAAGSDTWISLLPHLTVTLPEDLSTIDPMDGTPLTLYTFTSDEVVDPYSYIAQKVYPAIFLNDNLLAYDQEEDEYSGIDASINARLSVYYQPSTIDSESKILLYATNEFA